MTTPIASLGNTSRFNRIPILSKTRNKSGIPVPTIQRDVSQISALRGHFCHFFVLMKKDLLSNYCSNIYYMYLIIQEMYEAFRHWTQQLCNELELDNNTLQWPDWRWHPEQLHYVSIRRKSGVFRRILKFWILQTYLLSCRRSGGSTR